MESIEKAVKNIVKRIYRYKDGSVVEAMKAYGVHYKINFGVGISQLKEIASEYLNSHELALALWEPGNRERMILASLIDSGEKVTKKQIEEWTQEFHYLEICEQVSLNLFSKTTIVPEVVKGWLDSGRKLKIAMHLLARFILKNRKNVGIMSYIENGYFEKVIQDLSARYNEFSEGEKKQWEFLIRSASSLKGEVKKIIVRELDNLEKNGSCVSVKELKKEILMIG